MKITWGKFNQQGDKLLSEIIYDFQKIISIANIKEPELAKLGPYASQIAKMEGLDAHANSIDVRLERM